MSDDSIFSSRTAPALSTSAEMQVIVTHNLSMICARRHSRTRSNTYGRTPPVTSERDQSSDEKLAKPYGFNYTFSRYFFRMHM